MPAKRRRKATKKPKPARTRITFIDPYLRVKNVKRSADWYKRMLDFEVIMAMPNKSKPRFVRMVSPAGAAIMIGDGGDAVSGKKPAANVSKAISARKAQRVVSLYMRVPRGIDALYEACQRKRAKVVQKIITQPYGMRDFSIRDPDGYEVGIGQERAAPAAPKKKAPARKKTTAKRSPAKRKAPARRKATAKRTPAKRKAPARRKTTAKRTPAKRKAPARRKAAARKPAARRTARRRR